MRTRAAIILGLFLATAAISTGYFVLADKIERLEEHVQLLEEQAQQLESDVFGLKLVADRLNSRINDPPRPLIDPTDSVKREVDSVQREVDTLDTRIRRLESCVENSLYC